MLSLPHLLSTKADLAELVLLQMERVLAHQLFAKSPRLSQLLRFIVQMNLEGKAHCLKEYTIAVDVFKRPESFDCRLDSIVRVEAARLRKKLALFYRTAGSEDQIVLALPPSGYEPVLYFRDESVSGRPHPKTVALIEGKGINSTGWTRSFEHGAVRVIRASRDSARQFRERYDLIIVFIGPSETYSDYAWVTESAGRRTEAVLFVLDAESEASRLSVASAVRALTRDTSKSLSVQVSRHAAQTLTWAFDPTAMDSVA